MVRTVSTTSENNMLDTITAKREALRRNILEYSRLLTTELTSEQRGTLHRHLAEDWAILSKLNATARQLTGRRDEPRALQQRGQSLLHEIPDLAG
jgi:hypothetical protein